LFVEHLLLIIEFIFEVDFELFNELLMFIFSLTMDFRAHTSAVRRLLVMRASNDGVFVGFYARRGTVHEHLKAGGGHVGCDLHFRVAELH